MLIEELKRLQAKERLTGKQFAAKLGIHEISWRRIKNRRAGIGLEFLKGVRRSEFYTKYPRLCQAIDFHLAGEAVKNTPAKLSNQQQGLLKAILMVIYKAWQRVLSFKAK